MLQIEVCIITVYMSYLNLIIGCDDHSLFLNTLASSHHHGLALSYSNPTD
jgi:hypothetical protein